MLQSEDLPLGLEHMGRRQPALAVEAGEVVRGCGSKSGCECLGGPKAGQLPLRTCEEGRWGEMRARHVRAGRALPVLPPEATGRTQGLESNRPGSASLLCPF